MLQFLLFSRSVVRGLDGVVTRVVMGTTNTSTGMCHTEISEARLPLPRPGYTVFETK